MSHEELVLVLCTMDDVIIDQLYEESISSANEVADGMQEKHPVKQVKFVDEVEDIANKMIMDGNRKIRICAVDGLKAFIPFLQKLGLQTLESPVSSHMTKLVFMMPSQSMSLLRLKMV